MHLMVYFPAWQHKVLKITAGIYTDGVCQLLTSEKVLPLWLKNKKQNKKQSPNVVSTLFASQEDAMAKSFWTMLQKMITFIK